jgi:hypothetical protein
MRERRSETTTETSNKVRDKCAYCKNKGHDITTCRKRDRAEKGENDSKPGEPVKVEFRCYGCGNPGVTKRNCPLCSPHQDTTAAQTLAFHALSIEPIERPAIDITISGILGRAFFQLPGQDKPGKPYTPRSTEETRSPFHRTKYSPTDERRTG